MATEYRHTGLWVLPAFLFAGLISWPFSFLMGPWAFLVGLPGAAAILLVLAKFEVISSDLGSLAGIFLVIEVGLFVALLVHVAEAQADDIGWWLPVLEAVALIVVLRAAVRAARRQSRQGRQLAWEDLRLREARLVMTIGKAAVDRAHGLLAGQPGVDRTAAIRYLRRRLRRRPELGPVVVTAISERRTVWGWTPSDDPQVLGLAADLIDEAAASVRHS